MQSCRPSSPSAAGPAFRAALLVPALALALLAAGCGPKAASAPVAAAAPAVSVRTAPLAVAERRPQIRVTGQVRPERSLAVAFTTGGRLAARPWRAGDTIPAGEVVAALDLTDLRAQLAQAEAALEKARRDLARARTLLRDAVATPEQTQDAETAVEVAEAGVTRAQFALDTATVRAAVPLRVLRTLAEPGDIVGPGQPVLLAADESAGWNLAAVVTEAEATLLDASVGATVTARGGATVGAEVRRVLPQADPATGLPVVEIALPAGGWREGQFATASLAPAAGAATAWVPLNALTGVAGEAAQIYVARADRAEPASVRLLGLGEGRAWVDTDLPLGTPVITAGAADVAPGAPIAVVP